MVTRSHGNSRGPPEQASAPHDSDFRLLPCSPCIDPAQNLAWGLCATDIVGRHRLMYGGKSLNMDMGAYEYYINELRFGPGADATLTWSSLFGSSYSIFYSDDLLTWHLADGNVPSMGFETTSWTDEGSRTRIPSSLASRRFHRILENP